MEGVGRQDDSVLIIGGGLAGPVLRTEAGAESGDRDHGRADRARRVLGLGASRHRGGGGEGDTVENTSMTRLSPVTASSTRRSPG
jgi:hypothetical protein